MPTEKQKPLIFAHIGDLHITAANQQNYKDFLSITAQIAVQFQHQLDFVYLPGDNADNGLPDQYQLIVPALKMLGLPVYILAGDHDMEQGSLYDFYRDLPAQKLPFKERIRGINCLFLDVCGPGKGGPDFRLGSDQLQYVEEMLADCKNDGGSCVLFMHAYPDDLRDQAEKNKLLDLINQHDVALVAMGHTHYNEIANSGKTIYSATRSTGQIEEGPVGYSITSIDEGVVSWRFKTLEDPCPLVMITQPADYRLFRMANRTTSRNVEIRATILGASPVKQVHCIIEHEQIVAMDFDRHRNDWFTHISLNNKPTMKIYVEAITIAGRPGRHMIEIATPLFEQKIEGRDGSDALSVGAWPENGIPGTQLGPNRNAIPAKKK